MIISELGMAPFKSGVFLLIAGSPVNQSVPCVSLAACGILFRCSQALSQMPKGAPSSAPPATLLFPPAFLLSLHLHFPCSLSGPTNRSLGVFQNLLKPRTQKDTEDTPLGSGSLLFGGAQTTTQGCQLSPQWSKVEGEAD